MVRNLLLQHNICVSNRSVYESSVFKPITILQINVFIYKCLIHKCGQNLQKMVLCNSILIRKWTNSQI